MLRINRDPQCEGVKGCNVCYWRDVFLAFCVGAFANSIWGKF